MQETKILQYHFVPVLKMFFFFFYLSTSHTSPSVCVMCWVARAVGQPQPTTRGRDPTCAPHHQIVLSLAGSSSWSSQGACRAPFNVALQRSGALYQLGRWAGERKGQCRWCRWSRTERTDGHEWAWLLREIRGMFFSKSSTAAACGFQQHSLLLPLQPPCGFPPQQGHSESADQPGGEGVPTRGGGDQRCSVPTGSGSDQNREERTWREWYGGTDSTRRHRDICPASWIEVQNGERLSGQSWAECKSVCTGIKGVWGCRISRRLQCWRVFFIYCNRLSCQAALFSGTWSQWGNRLSVLMSFFFGRTVPFW